MTVYDIKISNCNSIDLANATLRKGALNIKYGPNGIGKSTISKAIARQINPDLDLADLTPFRNHSDPSAPAPEALGTGDMRNVAIFDDNYVQQFVFQKDEVLRNSFEIFIKTPEYLTEMAEIDRLLHGIRKAFDENAQIESTLKDLKELRDAFGKSKTGAIPKTSRAYKGLVSVNKLENIPETLLPYAAYLQSDEPSKWITWQVQGNGFLTLADNCPYCSKDIATPEHKQVVQSVGKEYDATTAGHISALKAVLDKLGAYLSEKTRENLASIIKSKVEIQPDEQAFLTGLKAHAEALVAKLEGLRSLSFFSLRDQVEISEKLTPPKIDLAMIDTMDSEETRRTVDPINAQLDDLIGKAAILKGMVNKNKAKISKTIKDNQESINAFLKSAGYRYVVEIVPEAESYKMKLNHIDQPVHIEIASRHLSYGEKNAFALVLFMYQVMRDNPDLVVLDDPISSFDKNKKFAILHELFNGRASLRNRTTLLLTHDIEPAIDVIKSMTSVFAGAKPSACFLSSRSGVVSEMEIEKSDLQTFARICRDNIANLTDNIIRSIYLRRHYELLDDAGIEYNLLASLFKGRAIPTMQSRDGSVDMSDEDKAAAQLSIRSDIDNFDYDKLVAEVNDSSAIIRKFHATNVGYEKIQLFRIIKDDHQNSVIRKFINESYHIENEYVMQLNPHKFEYIPEYVIEECSALLAAMPDLQ